MAVACMDIINKQHHVFWRLATLPRNHARANKSKREFQSPATQSINHSTDHRFKPTQPPSCCRLPAIPSPTIGATTNNGHPLTFIAMRGAESGQRGDLSRRRGRTVNTDSRRPKKTVHPTPFPSPREKWTRVDIEITSRYRNWNCNSRQLRSEKEREKQIEHLEYLKLSKSRTSSLALPPPFPLTRCLEILHSGARLTRLYTQLAQQKQSGNASGKGLNSADDGM
ncbi:hypothetical protein DFH11DRAFT_539410 [Phellopilus nigrolimitatus]|nr:hypothetical protein DFH11DRAFT_539410 [Phellopilus nigrolimitatus]